ncbi:MotA/TolQ/ExbB proton channel family protein [Opitutus sp. ER46]|uniref:MotA/TolQ/ExbB proton channel family protein n=1 Tax=Opitutus sp. ER46 TaxID=2161864 RepID=UPI000D2FDC79|nr:MotA/TolQ/ExbB proton channel family protein [Opitutus sp. ER46]PTX96479.1 MotA/TolQ/ExbB proton channel family protein [Opitutus sp. ER46]
MINNVVIAFLLRNPDGSDMSFMDLFLAGKQIMWPILLLSFVMITVVIERLIFIMRENATREPEVVEKMLENVERGDVEAALAIGKKSKDFLAKIVVYSLMNRDSSMSTAFVRASGHELARFQQGMATLDTCITAAPYLGLLGTVTGMMRTFGSLTGDIGAAAGQITGGVAEALIATMCGLAIAIAGLFPFNYVNARAEVAKQEVADVSHALELLMKKSESAAR